MPCYELDGVRPAFEDESSCFVAPDATLIGRIELGREVGIWFGVAIRGDNEPIIIGARTNVQEHTIMHTDPGFPLTIGEGCTIGHRALLHGCSIGSNTLIGMGAIVLNGAQIGNDCLVGAGALVTEGKTFPPGYLIVGSPAKAIRPLDDMQKALLKASAALYAAKQREYAAGLKRID